MLEPSMHAESAEPAATPDEGSAALTEATRARFSVTALARRLDLVFVLLLAVAAIVRLYGLNWDQGTHIHPDERFLTMVGNGIQIPSSLGEYLNPSGSPLNPANVDCPGNCPYGFYVYGILPITVNKLVAVALGNDTYSNFTLQGRALSAISDLLLIVFLYLTVLLLERRFKLSSSVKYLAVLFYGIAVLPIQLSHFFAVDSFLNLFMFASFYFALRYSLRGAWPNLLLSAALFGCAVGSKTSGLAILPLNLYFVLSRLFPDAQGDLGAVLSEVWSTARKPRPAVDLLFNVAELVLVYGLVSYFALRLADPYYFQSANPLDPRLSQLFLHNLDQLRAFNTPQSQYPPGVQWIHKMPVAFALVNLVFFGLGLPLFLFVVLGGFVTWMVRARTELFVILLWVCLFFLFQSAQYVKTMRYFIFLYPFLALLAAIGFQALVSRWRNGIAAAILLPALVWPLAFMSIYVHDHSRVQASEWMYRTLPNNSYILSEEWDDPLPLQLANPTNKIFTGVSMRVFLPDSDPTKWKTIDAQLKRGDYLVLSSNRGWGSMPTVPEQYPRMTRFYQDLFAGKTAYRRIATFTSYPSLRYLGIPIDFPDQWAEEAFTVYDHPEVMIFEHVR